jgi:hypothetical protein
MDAPQPRYYRVQLLEIRGAPSRRALDARNRGRSDSDEFSSLPRFAKTWSMDSTRCGASPGLTLIA